MCAITSKKECVCPCTLYVLSKEHTIQLLSTVIWKATGMCLYACLPLCMLFMPLGSAEYVTCSVAYMKQQQRFGKD